MRIKLTSTVSDYEDKKLKELTIGYGIITKIDDFAQKLVGGLIFRSAPTSDIFNIFPTNGTDVFCIYEEEWDNIRYRDLKPGEKINIVIEN